MDNYFSNINLLQIFLKWKWHLLAVILFAALAAVSISSPVFMKPRYRSFAVVYPSNLSVYSDESETEQMLQWLESKYIVDSMIRHFNLVERYNLDPKNKYFLSSLHNMYNQNVRIKKTSYEAVMIEVFDHEPIVACQMVDSIISFFNQLVLEKHSEKYHEGLIMMGNRLQMKQHEIDSVAIKLYELRTEYGIFDYPNQSREVARGFLRTVDGTNAHHINTSEVLRLKKNIEEKGGEWTKYNNRFFDLIAEYRAYKTDYEWALVNTYKRITFATIVTKPFPNDKKAWPVRWLILLYSVIGAGFFSIVIIAIIENNRKLHHNIEIPKKLHDPA